LANLEQILDEVFQTVGFLVQDADVSGFFLFRQIRLFQQIHISDDRRKGGLQVVRHIGDQIGFHFGTFDLFVHRFSKPGLDLVDLLPEGLEDTQIFRDGAVQISLGKLIGSFQQQLVLILDLPEILPQEEEQGDGINQQRCQSPNPQQADKAQYDKVYQYDLNK